MINAETILEQKIIPVYSDALTENNIKTVTACYDAGLRIFEFTNRHKNALKEFILLKKYCDHNLPEMKLGAGTIKNIFDATLFLNAGAGFLISPLISIGLIEFSKGKKVCWIPACATSTEIGMAENAGINLVKIFPISLLGGPAFIKMMKGPYPEMKFVVTGGIKGEKDELNSYYDAGVSMVGLGNSFFENSMNKTQITDKITALL
jgi:2-dehydro-3-deoxyphosphogluconate aldolase / (4S)-4-hydroxy-2-oxoglutarate aldolase